MRSATYSGHRGLSTAPSATTAYCSTCLFLCVAGVRMFAAWLRVDVVERVWCTCMCIGLTITVLGWATASDRCVDASLKSRICVVPPLYLLHTRSHKIALSRKLSNSMWSCPFYHYPPSSELHLHLLCHLAHRPALPLIVLQGNYGSFFRFLCIALCLVSAGVAGSTVHLVILMRGKVRGAVLVRPSAHGSAHRLVCAWLRACCVTTAGRR